MFVSATFDSSFDSASYAPDTWQDQSTTSDYIFKSPFGILKLRKRDSYPSTFAYVEGSVLKAGYGDATLAQRLSHKASEDVLEGQFYKEEFLYIEADSTVRSVNVQRDAFCTVPLFAAYDEEKLALANTFETVCEAIGSNGLRIDKRNLHAFITGIQSNTFETYIENCFVFGALENLIWMEKAARRERHALSLLGQQDVQTSDPAQFQEFLDALFAEYAQKYAKSERVACEFSGGIDSAMVAGYLADNKYDPLLLTVGYTGAFQSSQQQKIRDFQQRFRTEHLVIDLDEEKTFPLSRMALNNNWKPFYEQEETYREAFHALARALPERKVAVVFNGLGGDDALARFDFPHHETHLPSFYTTAFRNIIPVKTTLEQTSDRILSQFIQQKVNCNNVYLSYGIWPVAPFTDPRLISYCQSLKPRFRDNKNVYRIYCRAWHYPESIYHSTVNEDFRPFFDSCGTRYFLEFTQKWLEHSVLAAAGMINKEAVRVYVNQSHTNKEYFDIYRLIVAESNFQTLGASI
jgi:asparagine synthetase B (glutamine-hydrolysing)